MSIKRISVRFNLEKADDRRAWNILQDQPGSKNELIIEALNSLGVPNDSIRQVIESTIRGCLQNVFLKEAPSALSEEENELLDSLDEFLGD